MVSDLEEFREEFFNKYCDEEDIEVEDIDLETVKEIYS